MRHWWRRLILRVPLRKVVSRSHDGLSRNENHASLDLRNARCMSPTALYIEGIVCRPVLYESILKCTRSSCDLVSLTHRVRQGVGRVSLQARMETVWKNASIMDQFQANCTILIVQYSGRRHCRVHSIALTRHAWDKIFETSIINLFTQVKYFKSINHRQINAIDLIYTLHT